LRWLVIRCLGLAHADFLSLVSENANNISIKIERNFRKMAQDIAQDKDLTDLFLHMSDDNLAKNLPPTVQVELNKFLSKYGCRSRHRTLFIKRWYESPQAVIGILPVPGRKFS